MRHVRFLRAGSLVCLIALCLGLLTACGSKPRSLDLDEIYGADARPSKPEALNTVTEVIRAGGSLRDLRGNLALFVTRNEDNTLFKGAVYNLTNGKKLYEADEYHDSIRVSLLDGDLYSVLTTQDDGSIVTLYDAAGKQQFSADDVHILDSDLLYIGSSVYRIENGKIKNSGIPVASVYTYSTFDYPGRSSDGYVMNTTTYDGLTLTIYDLGMNPVAQYRFPSDAVEDSCFTRMLNNGDALIQYQLEVGGTDNARITEAGYDFEQDGKLIRLCTLILSAQTGKIRSIPFDGIIVNCISRRYCETNGMDLSDKVDNIVVYNPLDGNRRIDSQMVWAVMDNDGTVHPVEKLSGASFAGLPFVGVPSPCGKDFWNMQLLVGGDVVSQLYNKSGKLLKSVMNSSGFDFKIGWNRFSDGNDIYDESGNVILDGGKRRVTACAAMYAILRDSVTQEFFLYTYDSEKTMSLPLEEEESILQSYDSLFLTGVKNGGLGDTSSTDTSLPVRLFNYRGEQLGSYPDCVSATIQTFGKNSWLFIESKTDDGVTTTIYRLSK